jgi:hypothetical protein
MLVIASSERQFLFRHKKEKERGSLGKILSLCVGTVLIYLTLRGKKNQKKE